MSSSVELTERTRRTIVLRLAFALALFGAFIVWLWPRFSAWSELQSGKDRLESDPQGAREDFDRCLKYRPQSAEAHFYAAQAARLCGDPQSAFHHLDEAVRFGWPEADVEAQRKLTRQDMAAVERQLIALMAEFRWLDAEQLVRDWLEIDPGSASAWRYQGQVQERLRKLGPANESLRRAVQLDPGDSRARYDLARLILEAHEPADEASRHLEYLVERDSKNVAARVQLGVCREVQGRAGDAVAILDGVLKEYPADVRAHYVRGRLELNRGAHGVAVGYLRRATELDPADEEALYALVLALNAVGSKEEIRVAEERWRRAAADLKRVREIGRAIAASPDDPDLRCEIGQIFLRNHKELEGLRWLESALAKNPRHAETHRILADYYAETGKPDLARHHRSFLSGTAPAPR